MNTKHIIEFTDTEYHQYLKVKLPLDLVCFLKRQKCKLFMIANKKEITDWDKDDINDAIYGIMSLADDIIKAFTQDENT